MVVVEEVGNDWVVGLVAGLVAGLVTGLVTVTVLLMATEFLLKCRQCS